MTQYSRAGSQNDISIEISILTSSIYRSNSNSVIKRNQKKKGKKNSLHAYDRIKEKTRGIVLTTMYKNTMVVKLITGEQYSMITLLFCNSE